MDDLNSANHYRKAVGDERRRGVTFLTGGPISFLLTKCRFLQVVQHKMPCPTILTRQGDRISGNGKFGGAQNRAPPMHTLKVFGAPLPPHHPALKEHIGDVTHVSALCLSWPCSVSQIALERLSLFWTELLSQHRSALEKKQEATKEREAHLKMMQSPESLKQRKQMEEMITQLEENERELGMFQVERTERSFSNIHICCFHSVAFCFQRRPQ